MKNKNQLAYFENIIKNDRCNLKEEFSEVLLKDLGFLLSDYYDIVSGLSINVSKIASEFIVEISFKAKSPRYFSKLQNS